MDDTRTSIPHIVLTPRHAALPGTLDHSLDMLIRVQAPEALASDAALRPPQSIALVIDRSGSMSGRPLVEARRCAD